MNQRTLSLSRALLAALPEDLTDKAADFWIDHDSELAKIMSNLTRIPFRLVTLTGAHHESGGGNIVVDAMIQQSKKGRKIVLVLPIEEADFVVTDDLNYQRLNLEKITFPVVILLTQDKTKLDKRVMGLIKTGRPIYLIPLTRARAELSKLLEKVVKSYYDKQRKVED